MVLLKLGLSFLQVKSVALLGVTLDIEKLTDTSFATISLSASDHQVSNPAPLAL